MSPRRRRYDDDYEDDDFYEDDYEDDYDVPRHRRGHHSDHSRSNNNTLIIVLVVVGLGFGGLLIGGLFCLVPAFTQAKGAAKRAQSRNNLKQARSKVHH